MWLTTKTHVSESELVSVIFYILIIFFIINPLDKKPKQHKQEVIFIQLFFCLFVIFKRLIQTSLKAITLLKSPAETAADHTKITTF